MLAELIGKLEAIREEALRVEQDHAELVREVASPFTSSARNLLYYVALRRHDLRKVQKSLAELGLSSLGRCERWVLGNLSAVLAALRALQGEAPCEAPASLREISLTEGERLIDEHAARLLGPEPERGVRIMVTMPLEAAADYGFVRDLVASGMDCMRINCAHGTEQDWSQLLQHLDRARKELGRTCSSLMDLGGPNPRTLIPGEPTETRYFKGDRIVLSCDAPPRKGPLPFGNGDLPVISCTLPEILDDLSKGDRLVIDDGKIATRVEEISDGCALLLITRSSLKGMKLKNEKGINLPDTDLTMESLTDEDLKILPFIAKHADMVGYSFVRRPEDVLRLRRELAAVGGDHLGIVLKIETVSAFRALPRMLLAAMRGPRAGVMIARGDMAVEGGFERLAEVQEELLWFCEAAHLPVIWATEVLETFVKTGLAGRGEITDAAMGGRAECVMLNKGPHIVEAVRVLDDILRRMNAHQDKKRATFRPLAVSKAFLEVPA